MLLSIGMIVKNEETYLERCLASLQPILDNLDSELIIADTGSTDNSVQIAKRFTDKVYDFEWINDFSAARNFTLDKSSGEWFMYIDGDEIMQSCDELIRFFRSGEYKSYNSATYVQHSLTDINNSNAYADAIVARLTKRCPDVRFKNKIHEVITPLHVPIKHLNTAVDHYGYCFKNNGEITELAYAKNQRNLAMLMERLDRNDADFNIYKEIADCYKIVDDADNALKYINIGLETLQHDIIAINQYYSYKAGLTLEARKYDEVIKVCTDYFGSDNPSRKEVIATDSDMYAFRAQAYYCKHMYANAIDDFMGFFRTFKAYRSGKLRTRDLLYNQIKITEKDMKLVCRMFYVSCIKTGKYNTAADNFKLLPLELCADDEGYMINHFALRAEVMEHTRFGGIKKYALQLNEKNRRRYFQVLRRQMFRTAKHSELLKAMKEASGLDAEFDDAVRIYESYFIRRTAEFGQIEAFIKKYGALQNVDMLCIMLREGMDIAPYLLASDFDVNSCAFVFFADYKDHSCYLEAYDVNKISASALQMAEAFFGRAMIKTLNAGSSIARLFAAYGEIAARWQNEVGSEGNIPAALKVGIVISKITAAGIGKADRACIDEFEQAINEYKEFAPYAEKFLDLVNGEAAPQ